MSRFHIDFKDYNRFVSNLTPEEVESLGDDGTSCWLFAYYIHNKFGLGVKHNDCVIDQNVDINDIAPSFSEDGLYSICLSCHFECHNFILVIEGETLQMYGAYGGYSDSIQKTFNTREYIAALQNLLTGEMSLEKRKELYGYVFDIEPYGTFRWGSSTMLSMFYSYMAA